MCCHPHAWRCPEIRGIIVGVDGGASRTRAAAVRLEGSLVGLGVSGPSNYHNVGVEQAVGNIVKALEQALRGEEYDVAVVALAGMDTRFDREVMGEALGRRLKGRVLVEHDAHAALYAATGGAPGVVVIAGTGSIVYGYRDGERIVYGDRGWLLGDEGSAYWVGAEALRAAVRRLQEGERTRLAELVLGEMGARDLEELVWRTYSTPHSVERVAALAPLVSRAAEEGDADALEILVRGASILASYAAKAARRVGVDKVYYTAGMFSSPIYEDIFLRESERRMVRAERLLTPPLVGCLIMALEALGLEVPRGFAEKASRLVAPLYSPRLDEKP